MTWLFLASTLFLAYVLWSRTRRTAVRFMIDGSDVQTLFRSMAALTWGHVTEENRVTIVQNSGFFDALLDDVANARHHIHLETYLWQAGEISDRVSDALCARAKDGIEVRVLVDKQGTRQAPQTIWQKLTGAGCDLRVYHRARFREFALFNRRDHRKIAVIDGRTGYAFGHGIGDSWGGTPDAPAGFRDTGGRFEGPVVTDLQTAFFDNWTATTGQALAGDAYFPEQPRAGSTPVHVAYVQRPETSTAVQRLYYLAIAAAQDEILLQNPYFLPDRQALDLFAAAVARGVRVSVMLPALNTNDFTIVQHASHHYYGSLLRMGVRVYEHTRCGLHQKVMIVDRRWCSIGSTNFDPRSFRINEEISVAALDERLAGELVTAFDADVEYCELWTLERWTARTARHKLIDGTSALFRREL